MNDKLSHSQKMLHDSLFELYMQGGLELVQAGTRGLKRELIMQLPVSFVDRTTLRLFRASHTLAYQNGLECFL